MKKFISLILTGALLLSLACIDIFAVDTDPHQKNTNTITEYIDDTEINKQAVREHGSECEIIIPERTYCPGYDSENVLETKNAKNFCNVTFAFAESSSTFAKKITSDDYNFEGNVTDDFNETRDISDYFNEKMASRFDIIDIALENNIISENEKIINYCEVYELGLFENVDCLHDVVLELYDYYLRDETPAYVKDKIADILQPIYLAQSIELTTTASTNSYQSTHFIVSYDSGISLNEAKNTANYLENIRTIFINMGFKEPIKETGYTKYRVFLETNSHDTVLASTHPVTSYGVACSTYITIFNFSSLTTGMKERITHEYFHAIQGAYMWSNTNVWFDEAMANWGKIIVAESSSTCDGQIGTFLKSTNPIYSEESRGYGAVLLPLAIQRSCGTGAIKAIWEEYGKQTSKSLTFDQLKENVIDEALDAYDQSFNVVFFKMAFYNFTPRVWYASVHPGGYSATQSWAERITTTTNTNSAPRFTRILCTNQSIQPYSSNYHKFIPDVLGKDSKLTIRVTFSGTNASKGVCHSYYVKSDGTHVAWNLNKSSANTYTITSDLYGGEISWFGVVISNTATDSINYDITYKVERGSQSSVSFLTNHRYSEYTTNIGAGEYKDYVISFSNGGNKIIQTFGAHTSSKDGYLELFDMNSNKLASNDDSGYDKNALISYNFSANTQYRLRVTFFGSRHTGDVKIGIVPAYSTVTYEDIYDLKDYTKGLTWSFTQYNVRLLTYKYTSTRDLTMSVSSEVDTYLYIIDPRSAEPLKRASNFSPDTTKNLANLYNDDHDGLTDSQITKTFDANVPYLVVVSAFDPSLSSSVGEFYVDVE